MLSQELDGSLDDPKLFALVRQDLGPHYRRSKVGRPPVPVEVTLRLIVLRRRKKWSYWDIEQEVRDSDAYRTWTRVYDHPVPDFTTLKDRERMIRPQTLHRLNERVLVVAQTRHITQGDNLRVDRSVTETNIRYPVDNGLLLDGVRILSRRLHGAEPLLSLELRTSGVCSCHVRSARRWARQIGQLVRSGRKGSTKRSNSRVKKRLSIRRMLNSFALPASPSAKLAKPRPPWKRRQSLERSASGSN